MIGISLLLPEQLKTSILKELTGSFFLFVPLIQDISLSIMLEIKTVGRI